MNRKIELQPLAEYSSDSESAHPHPIMRSPSSQSENSDSSEDDELCMNEIEQRIRKLQKQLEGQVKRSAHLGIKPDDSLSNQAPTCRQCKLLTVENQQLKLEIQALKAGDQKARKKIVPKKPKQSKQIEKIVRSGKLKLAKEIELLQIIERLKKKLKISIERKRTIL